MATLRHLTSSVVTRWAGANAPVSSQFAGAGVVDLLFGAFLLVCVGIEALFSLLVTGVLTWWQLPNQWLPLPLSGFALAAVFDV